MKGVQAAVLGGSALILLILALRLTLKNHLPHRLFPALWCIAAIRFLLLVEIPTRLSVWNLLRGTVISSLPQNSVASQQWSRPVFISSTGW